MRFIKLLVPALLLGALVACSTAQLDKAKKISSLTIPFFTKIALAYGAPYAEIIRVFADTANPSWNATGKYNRENYAYTREEEYGYEDQSGGYGGGSDDEYDNYEEQSAGDYEEYEQQSDDDFGDYEEYEEQSADGGAEQSYEEYPSQSDEEYPSQSDEEYPSQSDEEYPSQSDEDYPSQSDEDYPSQSDEDYPSQSDEDYPSQSDEDYPSQSDENGNQPVVASLEQGPADGQFQEEISQSVDRAGKRAEKITRKTARKKTGKRNTKLKAKVDVVREFVENNRSVARRVNNGDTLNEDDNYKVQISCSKACFAYIAQLDSTGRMDPIFPSGLVDLANPLVGGEFYSMPQDTDWFYLDSSKGVEQIYFIISESPRSDIEQIFQKLSAANENLEPKAAVSIEQPLMLTKGIGGVRRSKVREEVQFSNGARGRYQPTILDSIEAELVVTRWFNHE